MSLNCIYSSTEQLRRQGGSPEDREETERPKLNEQCIFYLRNYTFLCKTNVL